MKADVKGLGDAHTVELWFWNGLSADAVLFSLGEGESLGVGGRLSFGALSGASEVQPRTWHHVALVRDGAKAAVYLDGKLDVSGEAAAAAGGTLWIGGRAGGRANFEGKIDEVAVYGRALSADEVGRHFAAAAYRP